MPFENLKFISTSDRPKLSSRHERLQASALVQRLHLIWPQGHTEKSLSAVKTSLLETSDDSTELLSWITLICFTENCQPTLDLFLIFVSQTCFRTYSRCHWYLQPIINQSACRPPPLSNVSHLACSRGQRLPVVNGPGTSLSVDKCVSMNNHHNLPHGITSAAGWGLGRKVPADASLSCCGIWTWYWNFFWKLASGLGRNVALSSPWETERNKYIRCWESSIQIPQREESHKRCTHHERPSETSRHFRTEPPRTSYEPWSLTKPREKHEHKYPGNSSLRQSPMSTKLWTWVVSLNETCTTKTWTWLKSYSVAATLNKHFSCDYSLTCIGPGPGPEPGLLKGRLGLWPSCIVLNGLQQSYKHASPQKQDIFNYRLFSVHYSNSAF